MLLFVTPSARILEKDDNSGNRLAGSPWHSKPITASGSTFERSTWDTRHHPRVSRNNGSSANSASYISTDSPNIPMSREACLLPRLRKCSYDISAIHTATRKTPTITERSPNRTCRKLRVCREPRLDVALVMTYITMWTPMHTDHQQTGRQDCLGKDPCRPPNVLPPLDVSSGVEAHTPAKTAPTNVTKKIVLTLKRDGGEQYLLGECHLGNRCNAPPTKRTAVAALRD